MSPCKSKCLKTASLSGPHGPRVMVSVAGNEKFPPNTPHPQCKDCAEQERREILAEIAKAFPPSPDDELFNQLEKLKAKT